MKFSDSDRLLFIFKNLPYKG